MSAETFWFFVMIACLVWYSSITVYVAVRGAYDVRSLFRNLERDHAAETEARK